jgi:hypothetical protein
VNILVVQPVPVTVKVSMRPSPLSSLWTRSFRTLKRLGSTRITLTEMISTDSHDLMVTNSLPILLSSVLLFGGSR